MKFILTSNFCSPAVYEKLIEKRYRMGQQYQKYMRLICLGIISNDIDVEVISVPPVNKTNCKDIYVSVNNDCFNNIRFRYIDILNIPFIRNVNVFFSVLFSVVKCGRNKDTVFLVDLLNLTFLLATIIGCIITSRKVCGIMTDMPLAYVGNEGKNKSFYHKLVQYLAQEYVDGYLFVTKSINEVVNIHKKPFCIIEGFSDVQMINRMPSLENKEQPRVCMYAGGLSKLYGLDCLVEGFIKAKIPNAVLHIYGDGDYATELKKICSLHNNVKYYGVVDNTDILDAEERATLLVNPRYTDADFTKYSFPSKNMEYMASGTPVLTTKLPGMPTEYYEYVYILEHETIDGMAEKLRDIFRNNDSDLYNYGMVAKNWIISNKNNVVAIRKLLHTIEKMHKEE